MKQVIFFVVLTIFVFSCSDNKGVNDEISISICGNISPDWVIAEINSIVQPTEPNHRPVSVYDTILDNTTYVLITDLTNDAHAYTLRFFSCSGESIRFESEKYNVLRQRYNENREAFTLLWTNQYNK
ncbi:MAG: hypothetical protein ACK5KP_12690 [Paludibacteraceae bacterium]